MTGQRAEWDDDGPHIYTVGHSNQEFATFLALLKGHGIAVLVDVRSAPYSTYAPQFDKRALDAAITSAGLTYLYLGTELGGRPEGNEFYDSDGRVVYSRVETAPLFLHGIERLLKGIQTYRIALVCSEENPSGCHRRLLIAHVLTARGVQVWHIRGDGSVQHDDELGDTQAQQDSGQLPLFPGEEVHERKSIRSVLPQDRRPTSSTP